MIGTGAPDDGARYCPRCATALVRRMEAGRERAACTACAYVAYRNPAPVAAMLACADDRLLLVRRANDPLRGFWAPPSGYVEMDESVEAAAVRETLEETGLSVTPDGIAGVFSAPGTGIVLVAVRGHVTGGTAAAGDEVDEVGLFAPGRLPAQPHAHSGSRLDSWFLSVLEELFAGRG